MKPVFMYLSRPCLLYLLLLLGCISISGCRSDNALPQAGICISFDDRSIEEWYSLKELLASYDAPVTFFISGAAALTDQEVQMLKELEQEGHEIGSHGALHVRARDYIREHSYQEYLEDEIFSNTRALQQKGFTPTAFAYPYGSGYWFTDLLLKRHFKVIRHAVAVDSSQGLTAADEIYHRRGKSTKLVAANIDASQSMNREQIREALDRAAARQEVLVLFGHKPAQQPIPGHYTFDVGLLEYLLQEAGNRGLVFYRVSELAAD